MSRNVVFAELSWSAFGWAVTIFVVSFTVSLLFVGFLLVRMPENYFLDSYRDRSASEKNPFVRFGSIIVRNLLGITLVIAGILLSLPGIPGQGVLTILLGIMLLDIPQKRRWARKILKRPGVLRNVTKLRERYGKSAFVLEEDL